jgi:hypothetical protein
MGYDFSFFKNHAIGNKCQIWFSIRETVRISGGMATQNWLEWSIDSIFSRANAWVYKLTPFDWCSALNMITQANASRKNAWMRSHWLFLVTFFDIILKKTLQSPDIIYYWCLCLLVYTKQVCDGRLPV